MRAGEVMGNTLCCRFSLTTSSVKKITMASASEPSSVETRDGDILAIRERDAVVCQQVNCVACKPHGLSQKFAQTYGYRGNVYARRTPISKGGNLATVLTRSKPGEIIYEPQPSNGDNAPAIAHLVGQYMFGKCRNQPYRWNHTGEDDEHRALKLLDDSSTRAKNFETCLTRLAERIRDDPTVNTVYFPFKIGCNLGGGDWTKYESMIEQFAENVKPAAKKVVILRLKRAEY